MRFGIDMNTDHTLEEVGKQFAKDFIAGQKAGGKARSELNSLSVMKRAIQDPNLYTGTGGAAIQSLKKAAQTLFGVPVQGVSSGEIVGNLSKQIALGLKDNLPGPMSDSDRRYLDSIAPGLGNSPDGNRIIIELGMLQRQYQIAKAEAARKYSDANGGRINSGFYKDLGALENQYAKQFSGLIGRLKAAGEAPVRSPAAGLPTFKSAQEFMQAPSGTKFVAPDGTVRIKP